MIALFSDLGHTLLSTARDILPIAIVLAAFQLLVTNVAVLRLARRVSDEGTAALEHLPQVLFVNLLSTLMVFVPLAIAVGILLTHRIAGPIYRVQGYLERIARGEDPGPCRIREGDMLQDLCDRLNGAVEALREGRTADPDEPEVADRDSQAA